MIKSNIFLCKYKQKNLAHKIFRPINEKIFIDTKRNSVQSKSGKYEYFLMSEINFSSLSGLQKF